MFVVRTSKLKGNTWITEGKKQQKIEKVFKDQIFLTAFLTLRINNNYGNLQDVFAAKDR